MTSRLVLGAVTLLHCASGCGGFAAAPGPPAPAAGTLAASPKESAAVQFEAWSRALEKIGATETVDPGRLRQDLQAIVAQNPNYLPAQYNLLALDELAGANPQSIVAAYAAIAKAHPEFAPGVENAAVVWVQQGEIDRATRAYAALIAADPKNQTSRLALARLKLVNKQYQEAMDLCRAVLARQADAIEAFRVLAHSYAALNDAPMAELIVGRGLLVAPKDVELHEVLAEIFLDRDDTTLGVAKLKEVVTMAPQRLSARAHLATVTQSFRDFGNAAQQYEAILAQKHDLPGIEVGLAVAYKGLGRFTEADTLYRKVLGQDPNNLAALWDRGVLCQKHLGLYDEATAAFVRFAALAPAKAPGLDAVQERLTDIARRKADVQAQAARQAHEQARAAAVLAACTAHANHQPVDGARIGTEPERVDAAWQRLAEAQRQAQAGNMSAAQDAASCAFAILPTSLSANTQACAPMYVAWTQILYQSGRLPEARKSIEAALACDAKNPDALLIAQQLKDLGGVP